MFEFLTDEQDAISVLKVDHATVKDLFDKFKKARTRREKVKIAAKVVRELKIHAVIEEEIFYPALRKAIKSDILNEADEEHHVAKILVAELEKMKGSEQHFEAKFTVLAENIRHHIKEEEGMMFPQAQKSNVDLHALGKRLLARKEQLKKGNIPVSVEEKMVRGRRITASPAKKPARKSRGKGRMPPPNGHDTTRTHARA